jgi:hypothetical protein
MVIVIVVKDDDPVQLRIDDIYDHSFVSTIQHHVHHISNRRYDGLSVKDIDCPQISIVSPDGQVRKLTA